MATMRLTGDAARKWLEQNQNGSFVDNRSGQVINAPEKKGAISNIVSGVTQPFRIGANAPGELINTLADIIRLLQGNNEKVGKKLVPTILANDEETQQIEQDPLQAFLKSGVGVASYGVGGGAAEGATSGARILNAAKKGITPGLMGGFSYSESGKELGDTLKGGALGGLFRGALQGAGEVAQGIANKSASKISQTGIDTYLDGIDSVGKIDKLPNKVKSNLKTLSKTAGFNDPALSDSKNILNYLSNRKLAGNTPGQTLENMTQEFEKASSLKNKGIKKIGGLSRDYLKQARSSFDKAIENKGLITDKEGKAVYKNIVSVFENGPQDAKSLDDIIIKWNEAGRNAKGEQKTSIAGLYIDGQKALRDVLRSTKAGGKYDEALKSLSQILGLDDAGVVSQSASMAEKSGVNVPLFQNAGFTGTDIKTPFVANTISKAQSGIAKGQLAKAIPGGSPIGDAELPKILQTLLGIGASGIPAVGAIGQNQEEEPLQSPGTVLQQPQGPQIDEMAIIQAVLSGQLSTTDAKFIMDTLGGASEDLSGNQSKAVALQSSLDKLRQAWGGTGGGGKLMETLGINIGTNVRSLDQAKSAVAEDLGRLQSQGAINPTELRNFMQMMPNSWDSPQVVEQKFQAIQDRINAYL